MTSLVGSHVSAAGGVYEAVTRASALKASSFALFLKNERQWKAKPYTEEAIESFASRCKEHNFDPQRCILPHGTYLVNMSSPKEEMQEKSLEAFIDELKRCEQLNIGLFNFHPGSSLGTSKPAAIKRLAAAINKAIKATSTVKIVLENMTGAEDRVVGTRLEDIAQVIELVEEKSRVGVCIDTCHSFTAGYDMRDEVTFDAFWKHFDSVIGMKYLAALHLNDSKWPFQSGRDVHQNIGRGFLGLEAFRLIMNHPKLQDIPKILETPHDPKGEDIRGEEIELLRWLQGKAADDAQVLKKGTELSDLGSAERDEVSKKSSAPTAKKRQRQATMKPVSSVKEEADVSQAQPTVEAASAAAPVPAPDTAPDTEDVNQPPRKIKKETCTTKAKTKPKVKKETKVE